MHFVHQRSDGPDSIPLLFSHGCKHNQLQSRPIYDNSDVCKADNSSQGPGAS
jgi:hypothetical protein